MLKRRVPHFVIDARRMGVDTVLLTGPNEHTAFLFRAIHMRLLAEAYDSYLALEEAFKILTNADQLNGYFSNLRNIETLLLILSPDFIDGTEQSRQKLRKIFADRMLSIDEIVQQLMKLPVDKEDQ